MDAFRGAYVARCRELDVATHPVVLEQSSLACLRGAGCVGDDGRDDGSAIYPHSLNVSGHALNKKASRLIINCFLNDEGIIVLSKYLRSNSTLQHLDLRGNNVQSDGAIALASLISVSSSLKTLTLEWNSIGLWNDGIKAIADALASTTTLETLDLRNNKIGPQGTEILATALKHNTSLKQLDMRWNNAGLLGGKALAEVFKWNFTLLTLDVSGNEVPEEYLKTIAVSVGRNMDRHNNITVNQRQAQSLSAMLQSIQSSHNDTIRAMQQQVSASDTQTISISKKLNQASTEIANGQSELKATQTMVHTLQQERSTLQSLLVQERGEWQSRKRDYERDQEKLNHEIKHLTDIYKTSRSEWTGKILELEAKLREMELKFETNKREYASIQEELNRTKEHEQSMMKQYQDKLHDLEQSLSRKLHTLTTAKDDEYRERIRKLEDRIRVLDIARSTAEEEIDAYKTKARNHKLTWDEQLNEIEQRLKREHESREAELQKRYEAVKQSRDSVQEQMNQHALTHAHTLKQHDMAISQVHAELSQRHEQLVSVRAQLASAQTLLQTEQLQVKELQAKLTRVGEDADRHRREHRALITAKEQAENELAKVKRTLAGWEEREEIRRRDELERLKGLEQAFGNYIRGSVGGRHAQSGV